MLGHRIAVERTVVISAHALVALIALAVTALLAVGGLLLKPGIQHPVIMVGVLEIVLGEHTVTGRSRVTCQRKVFFHQLLGIAPRPVIAAVEIGITARGTRLAATAATTTASAVTPALTTLHVILLIVHSICLKPKESPRSRRPPSTYGVANDHGSIVIFGGGT